MPFAIAISVAFTSELEAENIQLEPVTVTAAEKRPANLQNTPLSISSFDEGILAASSAAGIKKVTELTPNLSFYSVGSRRTALLYMRGLGSSGPNMPAVGFFVDDVYYPKPVCRTTGMQTL